MDNAMPSRASMFNANRDNVSTSRNDLNVAQKGDNDKFKESLPTTQNADNAGKTPDEQIMSEPIEEKSDEINVIKDYDWTYSKNKIRRLDDIPYIRVKEFKMIGNTYVSSLMTSTLLFPDIVESNTGQNSFFQKIATSFKDNSFGKFMGDSSAKVANSINKAAQKTGQWVTDQMKSIDQTAYEWGDQDLINNYAFLYLRKPTGFRYRFPYFENNFVSITNDFSDTYTGNDKSPIQEVLRRVGETADAIMQYGNVASVTEPGMYVQRPQFYNFKDTGATFTTEFFLFNTITPNAYVKNLELITRLVIQNTPHRHNRLLVDPPCLYELIVPGRVFYPYAFISELNVKHVGTKRVLKNQEGQNVTVPDAYQVELKFKSLTMEVNNFISYEMGTAGIDIGQRFGVGELFNKGNPPDLTELESATKNQSQEDKYGEKQTQTTNSSNKPNTEPPKNVSTVSRQVYSPNSLVI